MTRSFFLPIILALTMLVSFSGCEVDDPTSPTGKRIMTVEEVLKAFVKAFGGTLRGKVSHSKVYHSSAACEGIVNNSEIQTTLMGTSSVESAEDEGYSPCPICCGDRIEVDR